MRRRFVPAAALASVTGAALVVLLAWHVSVGSAPAKPRQERPLRIDSRLPRWLAPGARLVVRGRGPSDSQISLRVGTRMLATVETGDRGRFRFEARLRRPGRYAIAVTAPGERVALGQLRVRPVVLAAVGDVTFGSTVATAIGAYGARYPWLSVAPVLSGADIATANLEGSVSTRGAPVPGKEFTFRGPPYALTAAARFAGLDVVTVANNHSLDYGRTAFFDTLRTARRAGVAVVGGGPGLEAARRPWIVRRGGLRIAFLGYSDVRPLGFDAGPATPGTAPAFPDLIAPDVRRARRLADVVVVWFHWGVELARTPDARQVALAETCLRSGASLVVGAHPHVLQPLRRRGRTLVAWSLGNFVFPANSPGTERTGILLARLDARGVRGTSFRPARIAGVQPRLS